MVSNIDKSSDTPNEKYDEVSFSCPIPGNREDYLKKYLSDGFVSDVDVNHEDVTQVLNQIRTKYIHNVYHRVRTHPRRTLPRRTLPRRTHPRPDTSPTGHIPDRTFPRQK